MFELNFCAVLKKTRFIYTIFKQFLPSVFINANKILSEKEKLREHIDTQFCSNALVCLPSLALVSSKDYIL